jgi:hypothetical protein
MRETLAITSAIPSATSLGFDVPGSADTGFQHACSESRALQFPHVGRAGVVIEVVHESRHSDRGWLHM